MAFFFQDFVEKAAYHGRIARRIQYALPAAEKPSFDNRTRGVCYIITLV